MKVNKIYNGHVIDVLKGFDEEFIDCVVTSPPYWGLRDFEGEPLIWDEVPELNCEHDFSVKAVKKGINGGKGEQLGNSNPRSFIETPDNHSQFCLNCGAWKGQLGLEPDPDLFVKHLADCFQPLFDGVLKKTGTLWVNLGDTYASGNYVGNRENGETSTLNCIKPGYFPASHKNRALSYANSMKVKRQLPAGVRRKSLVGIPERFVLEMQRRGWIRRNTNIWWKPNCMPSSAKDRFTVDFEYLYFFTRSERYYFEQQKEPLSWSTKTAGRLINGDFSERRTNRDYPGNNPQQSSGLPKPTEGDRRNKRTVWPIPATASPEVHFATFPEELVETPIKAGCPENGVVLDPFGGTGTTATVARKLFRKWVLIDVKKEYCGISHKNLKEGNLEIFEDRK